MPYCKAANVTKPTSLKYLAKYGLTSGRCSCRHCARRNDLKQKRCYHCGRLLHPYFKLGVISV